MGFLKGLGSLIGEVTGEIVGGTVNLIGEVTGSEFIEEIGDGIKKASAFAGDKLGEAASGTWDVAAGIITQDEYQRKEGFSDLGQATGDTLKAVGNTVVHVAKNGAEVVDSLAAGDTERLQGGVKELLKVGAVGALSFGIIDLVDGSEGGTSPVSDQTASLPLADGASDTALAENPNSHHVEPHWRALPSGEQIWVDGDGNTSVNTNEGWIQSNPDYRVKL